MAPAEVSGLIYPNAVSSPRHRFLEEGLVPEGISSKVPRP
jgi:hypothetical protein